MITKEDAKIKLMKSGYTVAEDNSVLTIIIPENGSIKNTVKDVKELFLKIGYEASFGVKQHKFVAGEEEEFANSINMSEAEDDSIEENSEEELKEAEDVKEEVKEESQEDEYFDEEDENPEESLGMDDMDMLLNENSVQFSLEDFGMM